MRWLTRLTTFVVIAFVVVGLVVVVRSLVPRITTRGGFRTYVKFHDGSRLAAGSPVVIAGVRVGVIEKLTLEGGMARIDLRLDDGLDLPAETFATRRADSLFGDSYIELIPSAGDDTSVRKLRPGEPITHVVEGGSTDATLRAIATALPRIDTALDHAHDFLIRGRAWVAGPFADRLGDADSWLTEGHVEGPIATADRFVSRVDSATIRVSDALTTGGPEALRTLDRIDDAITGARSKMQGARDGLVTALHDTREGLDRVDEPLANASQLMAAIDQGSGTDWKGSLGRLVNDKEPGETIEDFTESARDAVAGLDRFRSFLGMRVELDAYSRDVRFYASAEIRARNDKFYLVEFERGPLGALPHDELSDAVNSASFTRTQQIEDRLRFTAQFGKQFGPLSLRGGIKDSTFGIGADALMLDGRLKLSADAFGAFTSTPRIKLTGALAVFRSLYVMAGVDDALNSPGYLPVLSGNPGAPQVLDRVRYGRDYFVGTALQFTDEDIAVLLRVYGAILVGSLL